MEKMSGRSKIARAAMACTAERGWDDTSMQEVRERAGVSNGSLFHHFPSRQALAAEVISGGLADHQAAMMSQLDEARDAQSGVEAVVVRHLKWVVENPRLARLLLSVPSDVLRAGVDQKVVIENRAFFVAVENWLTHCGWSGQPALPVLLALWTGPAQEYARHWLADPVGDPSEVAAEIAAGAWRAIGPLLIKKDTDE